MIASELYCCNAVPNENKILKHDCINIYEQLQEVLIFSKQSILSTERILDVVEPPA